MIVRGKTVGTGRIIDVTLQGEEIVAVEPPNREACDFGGPDSFLSCGFFDPQVNGFAGVDFNGKDLTPEALHRAVRSIAASGVTRFLPTLITASHERLVHQLKILSAAIEVDPLFKRMCAGIHLEGPYLSPEEGPRGIHPREFIRSPDWEEVKRLQEASGGFIRCITLAPEIEGALPFIEKAVHEGWVIGIGHTDASDAVLEDAARAGARLSTHLGNGACKILSRHRNPIEKQLSMDVLTATLIVDGVHLPDWVVKNYVRAKGAGRVVLTTDCMAGAGAAAGRYTLGDLEVEVRSSDRTARTVASSRLAGSILTMDQAIANVIRFAGLDLATAVQTAGPNSRKLFPEITGEIVSGTQADLVLFDYEKKIDVRATWIRGEKISV